MSQSEPDAAARTVAGDVTGTTTGEAVGQRTLTPAAQRALAEAAERRRLAEEAAAAAPAAERERGGRAGPDPVRYGDWENGGIASDF